MTDLTALSWHRSGRGVKRAVVVARGLRDPVRWRAGLTAAVFVVLVTLVPTRAGAAEPAAMTLPARIVTDHTITIRSRQFHYHAIAETLSIRSRAGETTAKIFTIAYVLAGRSAAANGPARPVSFVFNGGPGAAAVFLHLGALGPRILETPETGAVPAPPFRLADNPSTWLPFTDLVFIDPVGTGFSRAEVKDGKDTSKNPDKPFWSVHRDIGSLATVVRLWLTRHQRWASPVYLVGESYGGFRAAMLAGALPRDVGVTVSGLVLVSPALDLSALGHDQRDLLAAAFALPSYAATAAIDKKMPHPPDLAKVEHFALSGYLTGLARMIGEPPAGDPLIARIAAITGLRERVVRRHRGRISPRVFAREVLRSERKRVSLYDGTVARAARGAEEGDGAGDPVLGPAVAAFTAAFDQYAPEGLGYHTELPYRVLSREVSQDWDWQGARRGGGFGPAMASLEAALLQHPHLKVLIVNGRYDLVTPFFASRWLIDQLEVPEAVRADIRLRVYDGGHMMYMRPSARAELARDAAALYPAPPT